MTGRLQPMMPPAERLEIAGAGTAVGERFPMVEVASAGGRRTPREDADPLRRPHQGSHPQGSVVRGGDERFTDADHRLVLVVGDRAPPGRRTRMIPSVSAGDLRGESGGDSAVAVELPRLRGQAEPG